MFGFFNRFRKQQAYTLLARSRNGSWFRSFTVEAASSYDACRKFDTSETNNTWTRVSGATLSV